MESCLKIFGHIQCCDSAHTSAFTIWENGKVKGKWTGKWVHKWGINRWKWSALIFQQNLHQFLSWVPIPNVQLLLGTNSNNSCHRIPLMYSDNCPDPSPPVFNLSIPDPTQKLIFCWLWARETFNSLNIIKKSVFPGNYLLQRDWELKFPLCNQESARWLRWQTGNRFKNI